MADNSATAVYRGTGITTGGWRAPADGRDATGPECSDMTADHDQDSVRLDGENGENEAFGRHSGDRVPNLNVTRVSNPAKTGGLPSNLQTNPLTAGRRNTAVHRQPHGYTSRGK